MGLLANLTGVVCSYASYIRTGFLLKIDNLERWRLNSLFVPEWETLRSREVSGCRLGQQVSAPCPVSGQTFVPAGHSFIKNSRPRTRIYHTSLKPYPKYVKNFDKLFRFCWVYEKPVTVMKQIRWLLIAASWKVLGSKLPLYNSPDRQALVFALDRTSRPEPRRGVWCGGYWCWSTLSKLLWHPYSRQLLWGAFLVL